VLKDDRFGLTVLTMAYAVGHISGGHFNPAVTIGLWSAGRRATSDGVLYIIAQVVGAIAAASPHRCRPGRFYVIIRFPVTIEPQPI
jgi:hypothetical protein